MTGPHTDPSSRALADRRRPIEPDMFRPNPLRGAVVNRLALLGRRHANYRAFPHRGQRPSRHAIVFFYQPPGPGSGRTDSGGGGDGGLGEVAHRTFLDGPDVADLHGLLTGLRELAVEFRRAGVRHLIAHLADGGDQITRSHRYLGLATSTLHLPDPDPPDLDPLASRWPAWTGLAHLVDGTRMVMHSRSTLDVPLVRSTHTLQLPGPNPSVVMATAPGTSWTYFAPDDQTPTATQQALAGLHELLASTGPGRSSSSHRHLAPWTPQGPAGTRS